MLKLQDMSNVAILIVIAAITIGVGATITADIQTDMTGYNSTSGACDEAGGDLVACSAAGNGTIGLGNLGAKLPLVGTIIALAIVLGIVFSALAFRR